MKAAVLASDESRGAQAEITVFTQACCHPIVSVALRPGFCLTVFKDEEPESPFPARTSCDSTLKLPINVGSLIVFLRKMPKASLCKARLQGGWDIAWALLPPPSRPSRPPYFYTHFEASGIWIQAEPESSIRYYKPKGFVS